MDVNDKLELVRQVGEEIITEEELKSLLETKAHPVAYDGFEPSGTDIHIAQGTLRAININKLTRAGARFKIFVADWHAWANNKLGGDLEKIQKAGKYIIEVWKASGMDLDKVDFVWANEFVKDENYWKIVMQVARNSTLKRILRTSQIMGRRESDILQASQIMYPCMQCADIFHIRADITQLGMDQRKVNVLARELAPKLGFTKPVVVSHHMLMGLGQPPKTEDAMERAMEMKMSKSKPDSAIFMTDSGEDVRRKINNAYCPAKVVGENPLLEYCKFIVFEKFDAMKIERPEKFGGNIEIASYDELEKLFREGNLHPMDLKKGVAEKLNEILSPVREHFEKNKSAKKLQDEVRSFQVTR
ncbi:tyrosine--tRNA ligase [Candidatus Woesearchaeota archaeon]|nr:tyrosine--tRNA ligase [Candidatus Woesearchaeota archaeon]